MLRNIVKEFKSFAFRGNLIDLAVAVVIGVAFNQVVQSLVADILTPIMAAIIGQPDFSDLTFGLGEAHVTYGAFVTALINFLLVTFALFVVVKAVNRILHPRGSSPDPPKTRECPFCLTAIPLTATRCSACTSTVDPQPA